MSNLSNSPSLDDSGVINLGNFKAKFVGLTGNFQRIWKSQKGNYEVQFFNFVGSDASGFLPLGDFAYVPSQSGAAGTPALQFLIGLPSPDSDALAHPVDFEFILNDHGSGNPDDVTYWRLIPPKGYSSVGICFTSHDKPHVLDYWCVKNTLLHQLAPTLLWSDKGQEWAANGDLAMAGMNQLQGVSFPLAPGPVCLLVPPTVKSVQNAGLVWGLVLPGMPAMSADTANMFFAVGVPAPAPGP